MSAVEVQSEENQPMSLKVMRLTAPSLNFQSEPFCEYPVVGSEAFPLKGFSNKPDLRYGICELNPSLSVPSPLDTIYLGETFSSYICVNNETDEILQHMTLKVELQATYRHFPLIDTTITPQDIKPRSASQFIVHHEVKELGMHFLLCSVHYVTSTQERKFFKKIYKVNVLNPLAVKTKSNNLRLGGVVLLEVQIQNLSNLNMLLESLQFDPVDAFLFTDLNFVFSDTPTLNKEKKSLARDNENFSPNYTTADRQDLEVQNTIEAVLNDSINEAPLPVQDEKEEENSTLSDTDLEETVITLKNSEALEDDTDLSEINQKDEERDIVASDSSPEKADNLENMEASHEALSSEPSAPEKVDNLNGNESPQKETYQSEAESKEALPQRDNNVLVGNPDEPSAEKISVFGTINYLKPAETRQYLYKLTPKDITSNVAYNSSELGKLDIVWRSSFCSIGRLQTSQLTRRPPLLEMVDLRLVSIPELILVEVPFQAMCRVQNRTKDEMHLKLTADRTKIGSLLFSGISPLDLGPIGPGHAFTFELEFLPLTPGPHKLGGLKLTDLVSKISHEIDTLAEVFVQRYD